MKLGSLFDGIRGFPIRIATLRFPNMRHVGDITQLNGAELDAGGGTGEDGIG